MTEKTIAQLRAVFILEWRRFLRSRDGLGTILFSFAPLALISLVVFIRRVPLPPGRVEHDFAVLFQNLILQVTLFLGCLSAFGGLIRGEQMGKTLHHLFLAPVRREVIVLGKYLAALSATSLLFGGLTALSYLVLLWGQGQGTLLPTLASGALTRLLTYMLIVFLACAGYGAIFLVLGQWAKNPIFPAILVWGWEHINFLLPEVLKRLGLIHYLLSLSPVSVPEGFLAVLGEPVPVWIAVPAPVVLAAVLVQLACWKAKKTEIDYGIE